MKLVNEEIEKLKIALADFLAYPFNEDILGPNWETIFSYCVGGIRTKEKLLFDVTRGSTGWSCKTNSIPLSKLEKASAGKEKFEGVIQRCDIATKKGAIYLSHTPQELGDLIVEVFFKDFVVPSVGRQNVTDIYIAFLLRNKTNKDFLYFDTPLRIYQADEIVWKWANDGQKSLMGFVDGILRYRWYKSGTQLFGVYDIPFEHARFTLNWTKRTFIFPL